MNPIYRHRQKGGWALWLVISGAILTMVIPVGISAFTISKQGVKMSGALIIPAVILLVVFPTMIWSVMLMSSLTVTIDDDYIRLRFGCGVWRKKFALTDIIFAQPVKNQWIDGWGIHWFGSGWLYNVAGFDAVEIKMRNGKTNRIGTDEPAKLAAAVNSRPFRLQG